MDNGANLRASIPEGASFRMVLLNRRLATHDWQLLLRSATAFAWLGTLGNRSRRGFGATSLKEFNGQPIAAVEPSSLLPSGMACAFPSDCRPGSDYSGFATHAGDWLREARRILKATGKQKDLYFGRVGEGRSPRLASPILLRPWLRDHQLYLLLIGPKSLVQDVAEPLAASGSDEVSNPSISTAEDPVAALLAPPFSFDRFKIIHAAIPEWQDSGQTGWIANLVEQTKDPKYSGLRSQPWFPKA